MTTTHKVEVAFATAPDAVTPTWTDITAFVVAAGGTVTISRGRADQLSNIDASTCSMTLDNHDGRFTASYTGGAYSPNVLLGKRIRVSTNAGAGFVERFDGYVTSWPTQWAPVGKYAEASITAVDRLSRLGRQLAADNLVSTYYLASSPSEYWMFADPEDTVTPFNRSGTAQLKVGWPTFSVSLAYRVLYGAGTGPGYDGLTALQIEKQTLGAYTSPTYTFSESSSLTFSCFFRCDNTTSATAAFAPAIFWDGVSASTLSVAVLSGITQVSVTNAAGTTVNGNGTINVYDGATHHITAVWQGLGAGLGGTISLYVDGVLDGSAAVPTATLATPITVPVGQIATDFGSSTESVTYTCAHYALFPSALSVGTIGNLAGAGLTAFSGDTTLARTARLGGLAGVTPVVTGTAGTQSMSPLTDVGGASYLQLMQDTADTEAGLLFTQCDGQVRLRPRRDMQNQSTKWTLTTGQYGVDITFLLDDFGIVNDIVADRPSGNPLHQTNSTSVTANGTYSQQKTLLTTSDNEVLDYTNWTLATSVPAVRCSQVTVNLLTQPTLVSTWLTVELGDVIACTGLPTTAPASSVTMQVQGWTETIALDSYTVTMNTTPYLSGSVFTLNDATLGKLNTGGVLAY